MYLDLSYTELENDLNNIFKLWQSGFRDDIINHAKYKSNIPDKYIELIDFFWDYNIFHWLQFNLELEHDNLIRELKFYPTDQLKVNYLEELIDEIHSEDLNYRPGSIISRLNFLDINSFPQSLLDKNLIVNTWSCLNKKDFDEIEKLFLNEDPEAFSANMYIENLLCDFTNKIHDRFQLFIVHKKYYQLIKIKSEPIISRELLNEYPLVFKNKHTYQFFIFCINSFNNDEITKTRISKFYDIFQNNGFINEDAIPNHFFQFISEKFGLKMVRIISFTSGINKEKSYFDSLLKNFLLNHNLTTLL